MSALPVRHPARPAERPARPRLRVVEGSRHNTRYVILLMVVGALGIFGVVSLNALAAEASFEARALERQVEMLSVDYEELVAEVAALESPERIRGVATTQLGMVPAQRPVFLYADRWLPTDGRGNVRTGGLPVHVLVGGVLADPVKPVLGTGH